MGILNRPVRSVLNGRVDTHTLCTTGRVSVLRMVYLIKKADSLHTDCSPHGLPDWEDSNLPIVCLTGRMCTPYSLNNRECQRASYRLPGRGNPLSPHGLDDREWAEERRRCANIATGGAASVPPPSTKSCTRIMIRRLTPAMRRPPSGATYGTEVAPLGMPSVRFCNIQPLLRFHPACRNR